MAVASKSKIIKKFIFAAQIAMVAKIQNGTFVYIKQINIHNNKLGIKLQRYPPYYFKF
jgi:hypothetical protein